MKDRQTQSTGAQPRVPYISPFLHWLAMPAIVFLRSGFGYSFLSPKSVFLAFAWAGSLYLIYSRLEPGVWTRNWAAASFVGGASVLYLAHLVRAFANETMKSGKHDFHSGTSHLLRMPWFSRNSGTDRLETIVHLWVEPSAVLLTALILRGFTGEAKLSGWLPLVAIGMWMKEFINYWYGIRSEKKHDDIIEDAEDKMPGGGAFAEVPVPHAGGRKPRTRRPPRSATEVPDQRAQEQRFAEVLRLMPPHQPFDLQQAERHYRELMKAFQPDGSAGLPEDPEKAAELNAAIEFFRERVSQ